MNLADYNNEFGDIDLFLLDLLLKGHVNEDAIVLDAGCGSGRNTFFFLKQGYTTKAIDMLKAEVNATNFLSRSLGCGDVAVHGNLDQLPFENDTFHLVICSRVLHFANSKEHCEQMLVELNRVLKKGGILYLSMNSMIGKDEVLVKRSQFLLTIEIIEDLILKWKKVVDNRTILFEENHSETTLILSKK